MAIEGPLKELSIHDVFQLLDLGRKTGVLQVTSELRQNAGLVFFEEGFVVGAQIRSNPHRLGDLLLRAGKLTEADLTRAQAMQESGDHRRLGAILVEIGAIAERELARQVRSQAEEVVFELMSWAEGYFAFRDGLPADLPAEAYVRTSTGSLLMEAARRIDEWSRIEKKIPHLGIVPIFAPPPEGGGTLDLMPAEWELLAVVDGQRDVRALARVLQRAEFDVAKSLFGLASTGIILLEDPARRAAEAASGGLAFLVGEAEAFLVAGDLPAALAAADAAALAHPHHPLVYQIRGRALLAAGRGEEASDALWTAVELDPSQPAAYRYLGCALVAVGRFREAVEVWDRWRETSPKPPDEEAQSRVVEQLRQAALTIDLGLRSAHE